jgi:hypothetical protein
VKVTHFLIKYHVSVPITITYFGYTCKAQFDKNERVVVTVLELPYKSSSAPVMLKEKVFYYLQAEGFIGIDAELS